MAIQKDTYLEIQQKLTQRGVTLVAVSKTKPVSDIQALYNLGHRDFGENYVQELVEKEQQLPKDIRWHFIGHLQSNKVKYIAPFVHLIHGVDSYKLLQEINKQAVKNKRTIGCLLQIHIAQEETKFGLNEAELHDIIQQLQTHPLAAVHIQGLMGMASFSNDIHLLRKEFQQLAALSKTTQVGSILSMGMSSDYSIAIEEGSNMVRIGSLLFGAR